MKVLFRTITFYTVLAVCLLFSEVFAAGSKDYSVSPPEKPAKKWRIGYLEGGPYKTYQDHLIEIPKALAELGWIEKFTAPPRKNDKDTEELWKWLSANTKSRHIEFVANAYYSDKWDKDIRRKTKKKLLKRLNDINDIDLMIAMGTWAGQDLANNDHSVPTFVCSTSDPVRAKIVKSPEDSGYDHVHACVDMTQYARQVRAFHDVIDFKKLGVVYLDTVDGRSYAAIEDVEKVAGEKKFEIVRCCNKSTDQAEVEESTLIECMHKLAPKIDAFYITIQTGVNPRTLPKIIDAMNAYNVPIFSQAGEHEVRKGAMLCVGSREAKGDAMFYAQAVARVINGAKPRDLNQIHEIPIKFAFNAAAAMKIGLKPEIYNLLSKIAGKVYKEIEQ